MQIKRSAFLLLTSALAHQACVVENSDDEAAGGSAGAGEGGSAGSKASGGAGGKAGAGTGGKAAGGSGNSSNAGEAGEAGAGATGGTAGTGGSAGTATAGGQGGEAQGGAGGESSCDDSMGTPGDCTVIDETDCSWERGYCTSASMYLKPKVAEAAVACMVDDPACLTSGIDPYGCVRTALAGACADSSKDAFCADAVVTCDPNESIDEAGCHALVDGLNDDGLALVSSCVEGGCSFGLWSCVEGVQ